MEKTTFASDARTQDAPTLLRSAAKLIERALIQLDMAEAPCPCCHLSQFHNIDQARIYEQLTDTPTKLKNAAQKIQDSVKPDGEPVKSGRGWKVAAHARLNGIDHEA